MSEAEKDPFSDELLDELAEVGIRATLADLEAWADREITSNDGPDRIAELDDGELATERGCLFGDAWSEPAVFKDLKEFVGPRVLARQTAPLPLFPGND